MENSRKRPNSLVKIKEAAALIGVSEATLNAIRWAAERPIEYEYLNGRVYYRMEECLRAKEMFVKNKKGDAVTSPLSKSVNYGENHDS